MPLYVGSALATDVYNGLTPADSVFLGGVEVWRREPTLIVSITDSAGTGALPLPDWVVVYDIISVGGGSGGTGGGTNPTAPRAKGGKPGGWNAIRVVRSSAAPVTVSWSIGDGGPGGVGSFFSDDPGDPGQATTVDFPGGTLTCPGGSGEYSSGNGGPAGDYTFNGFLYVGGGSVPQPGANNAGSPGYPPGSGGAGGYWKPGGRGAPGGIYIRAASVPW